jgi:hypothetical protein
MEQILNNIAASAGPLSTLLYILLAAYAIDTLSGAIAAASSGRVLMGRPVGRQSRVTVSRSARSSCKPLGAVAIGGTDNAAGTVLVASTIATATQYLISAVASTGLNIQAAQDGTKGLPASVAGGRVDARGSPQRGHDVAHARHD